MTLSRRPSALRGSAKQSLFSLGIDLLSLKRLKSFLDQHQNLFSRQLLTSSERQKIKGRRISLLMGSKYFSAKEAYFKTLDRPWMGREGFGKIEIRVLSENSFQASWLEKGKRKWPATGTWASAGNHVIAQVIREK